MKYRNQIHLFTYVFKCKFINFYQNTWRLSFISHILKIQSRKRRKILIFKTKTYDDFSKMDYRNYFFNSLN
jgi:hypothetical protein